MTQGSGTLLGLACGDALGRPVEFKNSQQIKREHGRLTELLGDGTHRQPPGTITDDTELALCIARSLVECGEFDPQAVVGRFVEWYESDPFDIGRLTASTLRRHAAGGDWQTVGIEDWKALPEGQNAGNGSLMRCAPYGIAFHDDLENLTAASRVSSALTHADPRCQWGCVVLNTTIAGLLRGVDEPLQFALTHTDQAPDEVRDAAKSVASITSGQTELDEIELDNGGYVVTTLQSGLYHGLTAESAEDAIIDAVMMGGDTDTLAAVTGSIAGARFGSEALPDRWIAEIDATAELEKLSGELSKRSFGITKGASEIVDGGKLDL